MMSLHKRRLFKAHSPQEAEDKAFKWIAKCKKKFSIHSSGVGVTRKKDGTWVSRAYVYGERELSRKQKRRLKRKGV